MLGLSYVGDLHVLTSLRYRGEFGAGEVYTLPASSEKSGSEKHAVAREHRGRILFGKTITATETLTLEPYQFMVLLGSR